MEESTTHIRMQYCESEIVIVATQQQNALWHQTYTYANHHTWLPQVYRTLLHTDQRYTFMHEIDNHTPSLHWHAICRHTLAMFAAIIRSECVHVLCVASTHCDVIFIENWLPHSATHLATSGHRINGIMCPAHTHYLEFLQSQESRLLSGALFQHDGVMIRNGSTDAERRLAHYWHTQPHPIEHV